MSELTTSKINRLFRTLRSKCASLGSFKPASSKPTVSVTYGHSSRGHVKRPQDEDEIPPLAILQSLDKISTRLRLDRAIVENMQLAKHIYEVRDAFRNIVQAALGPVSDNQSTHEPPGILPLTALCARLIGEHVQSEMDASLDDDTDPECQDELRSQTMDDLYESVPCRYRQYVPCVHLCEQC